MFPPYIVAIHWWALFWGHLDRQYDPMPTHNGKAPHTKVARLYLFYHLQQFPTSTAATYFTCIFCGPNSAHHWFLNTNFSCNLHTFEKLLQFTHLWKILLCLSYLKKSRTAKKSPTLTSLFFLLFLFDPPHSSFPIPIFGGVSLPTLHLYISRVHLQKFSGPAGPKGKRKKGKRGKKKREH